MKDNAPSRPPLAAAELEREMSRFRARYTDVISAVSTVVIGQDRMIEKALTCLLAEGHLLVEGAPGLGKTLLALILSETLGLSEGRIQFNPDVMPADITGTTVLDPSAQRLEFRFERGPVFTNILLADEINRATPKTQSALLEAMQERQVTVAGVSYPLPRPFLVLATQNPLDMEGTYPLPESQIDRFFFKIRIGMPSDSDLVRILDSTTARDHTAPQPVLDATSVQEMQRFAREVPVAQEVLAAVSRLLRALDPRGPEAHPLAREALQYGGGVRAGQCILRAAKVRALLAGRCQVSFADALWACPAALRHRVRLNVGSEINGRDVETVINEIATEVLSL